MAHRAEMPGRILEVGSSYCLLYGNSVSQPRFLGNRRLHQTHMEALKETRSKRGTQREALKERDCGRFCEIAVQQHVELGHRRGSVSDLEATYLGVSLSAEVNGLSGCEFQCDNSCSYVHLVRSDTTICQGLGG